MEGEKLNVEMINLEFAGISDGRRELRIALRRVLAFINNSISSILGQQFPEIYL